MSWNDLSLGCSLKLLQALSAAEPSWVVTSQPTLRDTVTPVLNNMAMITDEQESSSLGHVDLHTNQTVSMTRQMVQGDALAKVESLIIECLPVQSQLQIMLQINTHVRPGGHTPKGTLQLAIMHPNLDILSMHKHI